MPAKGPALGVESRNEAAPPVAAQHGNQLLGSAGCMRAAGAIINITSVSGRGAESGHGPYFGLNISLRRRVGVPAGPAARGEPGPGVPLGAAHPSLGRLLRPRRRAVRRRPRRDWAAVWDILRGDHPTLRYPLGRAGGGPLRSGLPAGSRSRGMWRKPGAAASATRADGAAAEGRRLGICPGDCFAVLPAATRSGSLCLVPPPASGGRER